MRNKLIGLFIVLLLVGGGVLATGNVLLDKKINIDNESQTFVIEKGDSITRVASRLAENNIIVNDKLMALYARLQQKTNIKTGEYQISSEYSIRTLLDKFIAGDVVTYTVSLIEGWSFKEALLRLHAQEKLEKTLVSEDALNAFFNELSIANQHPEGWFFPDTYQYSRGESDAALLKQAYRRMQDVLQTEWQNRDENLPYKTPYEALIMASIVEKETGAPHERQQIAGVFVRRLQKNMRLQTDPTVIYGMGDSYAGNIRRKDLTTHTPYNTYMISGLPPTPIALPGREAIHAALHPDDGTALYFVARGDGSHQFSDTLEAHNKAVREYQIIRRAKNYQSAPQQ